MMRLNIGILGTRGIPNNYGGFEHIAGCLAKGLVERGHAVSVYNSHNHPYQQKEWNGVRIIHCFDPEYIAGTAGQFVYDYNCIMDSRKKNFDILLILGYTSSSVWGKLFPKKPVVIINMDGMEWQRTKYSKRVRNFLKYAEKLGVRYSDFHIADSPVIKKYLDKAYGINSRYIAYGAELEPVYSENHLAAFYMKKDSYYMLMARMEPENNIEMILDGYCESGDDSDFLVLGNTGNRFGQYLVEKYKNQQHIIFPGAVFNKEIVQSLIHFCKLYFHGHSVGGTNPSLLDAMALKASFAAHENAFNRAVLNDNACYFNSANDVSEIIRSGSYANALSVSKNYEALLTEFNWTIIIDQYEEYFIECYYKKNELSKLKHEEIISYT